MFSEPVIGDRFFGRQEVLDLFRKRVLALRDGYRQNMALTGQSLVGKSSIILHFLDMIKEEGFVPVYVEVIKEPFRQFSSKFVATLLYNALAKKGQHVSIDLTALMELAREHLPRTYNSARQISSLIDRQELDAAYSALLNLTSLVKDETGFSCIVILDEFDNLETLGVKNPFLVFGKVIMVQKETMYVVSSSRNRAIKKIISEKLSLLFGNFEVIKIANFDAASAREFIRTKLAGFDLEPGLEDLLIHFTDGNAFYLDRMAKGLKESAISKMSSYVDRSSLVSTVLDLVYDPSGIIHQYLLNFVSNMLDTRVRDDQLAILTSISAGHNKLSDIAKASRLKQTEVSKHLITLLELGILAKNGVFCRIEDAMLSFWLANVMMRKKTMLVSGTIDKMSIFRSDVEKYVSSIMLEFAKPSCSRIEELFDLFSNELVQIDHRQMRLPRFAKIETVCFENSRKMSIATSRSSVWALRTYDKKVSENDIINYVKDLKSLDNPAAVRIIIPLEGIDENSKLLAKELKMSIWEPSTVNSLLDIYGKSRIITQ